MSLLYQKIAYLAIKIYFSVHTPISEDLFRTETTSEAKSTVFSERKILAEN